MEPVVVFDGVWKRFHRGERHDSFRDLIPSLARRLWSSDGEQKHEDTFWAVRDVSFEVHPGEALGIIGANGAGKSTTLKLLTRILKPTRGSCHINGRVGALIEVAAGFHPDLTGRENVFLQGAIMGMKRREIASRFDDIVDFAGVGPFIDTPVKRYSSGMNARLGFSIAAHLNPQVLIIDEVLAVGDGAFQQRCFERMESFVRNGVAIVLVSHNLTAINQLCARALLLDSGGVAATGPSFDVIASYCQQQNVASSVSNDAITLAVQTPDRPADAAAWSVVAGSRLRLRAQMTLHRPIRSALVGVVIWDLARNLYAYGATSDAIGLPLLGGDRGDSIAYDFEFDANLARGVYAVEVNVFDIERQEHVATLKPAAQFTISEQVTYSGVANLFMRGHRAAVMSSGSDASHPAEIKASIATAG